MELVIELFRKKNKHSVIILKTVKLGMESLWSDT